MFDKSSMNRHKNLIAVKITMVGEAPFDAGVFIKHDERLIDLLNDDRKFIPVRTEDDTTLILAKSSIISIIEDPEKQESEQQSETEAPKRSARKFDPYEVLRVSPDATLAEIRSAYKKRLKAVHPDTLAALDLDEDLTRAANLAAQKVNRAYKKIVNDREAEAAKGGACSESEESAA